VLYTFDPNLAQISRSVIELQPKKHKKHPKITKPVCLQKIGEQNKKPIASGHPHSHHLSNKKPFGNPSTRY